MVENPDYRAEIDSRKSLTAAGKDAQPPPNQIAGPVPLLLTANTGPKASVVPKRNGAIGFLDLDRRPEGVHRYGILADDLAEFDIVPGAYRPYAFCGLAALG